MPYMAVPWLAYCRIMFLGIYEMNLAIWQSYDMNLVPPNNKSDYDFTALY